MAIPVRAEIFAQLQGFLEHDLKNVLRMGHGGNYTAALIIAVGCEALSRLLDEPTHAVLLRLFSQRGIDKDVAGDITEALRHSLAHIFDTTIVQARKREIELVVSWGAHQHLSVRQDPPGLYLNVRTMWEDLQAELVQVQTRLASDPEWAKQVPRAWQQRWVKQARGISGWDRLFGN